MELLNRYRAHKTSILITGMVLLALVLAYRFLNASLGTWSLSETIQIRERQLEKYRNRVGELENAEAQYDSLRRTVKRLEYGLLAGSTPALAAVEIQNILNRVTRNRGVEIRAVKVMQPETKKDQGYIAVPVQVTVVGTTRQLKEVLYGITKSRKIFLVKKLDAQVAGAAGSGSIRCNLVVSGFMKKNDSGLE